MNITTINNHILILQEELMPALGCTEPIAVAFAAAKAREVLGQFPEHITVHCSGNIIKNVKFVTVPNSRGLRGIDAAAILGVVGGCAEKQLEVLDSVIEEHIIRTRELLEKNYCDTRFATNVDKLYIRIEVAAGQEYACVIIQGHHTNITDIIKNGDVLLHHEFVNESSATRVGDRLGKTIIFAQNKKHAEFILQRFNKLYPKYNGTFAQRVICDDTYAQTVIDDFKQPEKEPHIAVSVDMMDTGIDVPQCVNLVFFKKVRSKAKFWQMIGRGTRLCKGLTCTDQIDGEYTDKRRFLIFDYCGNFEYFREHKEGYETRETKTLSENIFGKRVKLISLLQESTFADSSYQSWRKELVGTCHDQVKALDRELIEVRLRLQFAEKYSKIEAFACVGETEKSELLQQIAPIVHMVDTDEYAKRFDNFMYGLILADL